MTVLVNGQYYHVFNRGINRQEIFSSHSDYFRAMLTVNYYKAEVAPLRLSYYLKKTDSERSRILQEMSESPQRVLLVGYCLMPNHFHFLLRQEMESGISGYLADIQNSYTKYYNAKHERMGSMLNRQFKAVRIESEGQLLHVARYINLNPYSGYVVKTPEEALNYPYTFIDLNKLSEATGLRREQYRDFVMNHADYQKRLGEIKHLAFDD